MVNEAERHRGRVKWFDPSRGIGFIQRDGARDVFVHFRHIVSDQFKTLERGEEVEFSVEEHRRGPRAVGVVKL